MSTKKYVSLSKLSTFLDNLKTLFATKTEVNAKADSTHNHDTLYDTKGSANTMLQTAQTYTDNAIAQKSQVQIITWGTDD